MARYNIPSLRQAGKTRQTSKFRYKPYGKRRIKYLRRPGVGRRALVRRNQTRRMVKNTLFSLSEKKFAMCTSYNENMATAIQSGEKATCNCFVLGDTPAAWNSDFKPLSGIAVPIGEGNNQRIGEYVQLQHTSLYVNIDMKFNGTDVPPLEFRVIHFRQRRNAMPAGINPDPATSLFLNLDGQDLGHKSSGVDGTDLICQPINKRKWIVYRDTRFVLTKPSKNNLIPGGNGYPCLKNFRFKFPFNTKAKYGAGNVPENVAYHHGIAIYARTLDKDQNGTVWEVNTRGTTTYVDF